MASKGELQERLEGQNLPDRKDLVDPNVKFSFYTQSKREGFRRF